MSSKIIRNRIASPSVKVSTQVGNVSGWPMPEDTAKEDKISIQGFGKVVSLEKRASNNNPSILHQGLAGFLQSKEDAVGVSSDQSDKVYGKMHMRVDLLEDKKV